MAVTEAPPRLATVRLITRDSARLAAFYEEAFGYAIAGETVDQFGEGRVRTLTCGHQSIDLLTPHTPGQPYPDRIISADTIFQHIAIVVPDMTAAMKRLARMSGWVAISTRGPERLPQSSGGVTAFKFRDPEGHPLEFLQFSEDAVPPAWQAAGTKTCLGYDHSAITVSDTHASVAFYEKLGLSTETNSLNQGPEQSRLDDQPDAVVEVTGLRMANAPPHLELLCYRAATARTPTSDNDVAATQLVFETPDAAACGAAYNGLARDADIGRIITREGRSAVRLRDPDGHRIWLLPRSL